MSPSGPSDEQLDAYARFAARLADAAGAIVRQHFRRPLAVDRKADGSPVTVADREAEQAMRALIAREYPSHGVIGEELGSDRPAAERVWVLDPIDGTQAFVTGKPSFGTLIALLDGGTPVLGLIDQPITRERWVGHSAAGTTLNGKAIRTRSSGPLTKAALYATTPHMFNGSDATAFQRLRGSVGITRYGADCYAYGLLAAGFVDLVVEASLQPYDYCALVPVVAGAGGLLTDWDGQPLHLESDGRVIAASDPAVHRAALDLLREGGPGAR